MNDRERIILQMAVAYMRKNLREACLDFAKTSEDGSVRHVGKCCLGGKVFVAPQYEELDELMTQVLE